MKKQQNKKRNPEEDCKNKETRPRADSAPWLSIRWSPELRNPGSRNDAYQLTSYLENGTGSIADLLRPSPLLRSLFRKPTDRFCLYRRLR